MNNSLVSILIPVYNRVNLVGETIESAINQTYKNIEIIISDNCSTDGTWELLREYEKKDNRIRVFQNKENIGPVLNWQRCIAKAKGEYVKILFSDDLISSNFVEETIRLFDNETAFVLSDIKIIGAKSEVNISKFKSKSVYDSHSYFKDKLLENHLKFPDSPGAALFRTKDVKQSLLIDIPNEFNLKFSVYGAGNDLLIFLFTAKKYPLIKISNKSLAYFRTHDSSFTINNNLVLYYNYSKYFFIKNEFPNEMKKLKTVFWIKSIIFKENNPIINLISENISMGYSIYYLLSKTLVIFR